MRYGRALTAGGQGTRVRLFPQAPFLARYRVPEVITLSPEAGTVGPGPSDRRMYALWPVGKLRPYGLVDLPGKPPMLYVPPWDGPFRPPARPGPDGQLDSIPVGTDQFELAHAYGVVRFTLDVWEGYLGQPVKWHFEADYRRLELSIFRGFANARGGYGFLEFGAETRPGGTVEPFALNLDIGAHETGHLIIYSLIGLPDPVDDTPDYYAFHESAADLVALLTAAHFGSVVDEVFDQTRGNISALNRLNRFAELSDQEQIRTASNAIRLREFAAGWTDEHLVSMPLTGCIFDVLVDLFHELLVERGLIPRAAADLVDRIERDPALLPVIQAIFDQAFPRDPAGFAEAFADARDLTGLYLARCWRRLRGKPLTFARVIEQLIVVDREATGGRYAGMIRENADWRDIGRVEIGPRLAKPDRSSHGSSDRTITPAPSPQPLAIPAASRFAGQARRHHRCHFRRGLRARSA
jgi:hypothetical protein